MHATCLPCLVFFELGLIILVIAYLINPNCKAPHYVIFSILLLLPLLF
jgi:hypothetical protein